MPDRKVREFQRLLVCSEHLEDLKILKANLSCLGGRFDKLRSENSLPAPEIDDYTSRLKALHQRLTPRVVLPPPKPHPVLADAQAESVDIAQERIKHEALATELLNFTQDLKESIGRVAVAAASDLEILNEVGENMEGITDRAQITTAHLTEVKGERIGWKAYYWLLLVIFAYVVISFLFL
jgi:hypothetical protein